MLRHTFNKCILQVHVCFFLFTETGSSEETIESIMQRNPATLEELRKKVQIPYVKGCLKLNTNYVFVEACTCMCNMLETPGQGWQY